MKDWVVEWLQNEYGKKQYKDELHNKKYKEVNLDSLEDINKYRSEFLSISIGLMKKLSWKFGSKEFRKESESFGLMFGTVLAHLQKDKFDILCNTKNVLYIYQPAALAFGYGKEFDIPEIDKGEKLVVVVFTHELSRMPWSAGRGIIVHELIHVITRLGGAELDEKSVNEIAMQWGYKEAIDRAKEYTRKKRESISKPEVS